jgi:NADPH:quinone reductase-like Zn-dependent oxidoreductase
MPSFGYTVRRCHSTVHGEDTYGMRAVGICAFGGTIEQLELPEPPEPGRRDVLVDVLRAGIGNEDDLVRTGRGTWRPTADGAGRASA